MNRREMLLNAGAVAGMTITSTLAQAAPLAKSKIIVTGGHPGDPEYGCGGLIARLAATGHEVVLLYLNDGAWQETTSATRIAEARKACGILNARPAYANQINGHAIVDNEHYDAFRKIIDNERPDAVFTHWPIDNHADHRAIANLTYESWKQLKRGFALYYYEVSDGEDTAQFPAPTHYVHISEVADKKKAACYAHASQTPDRYYELQDSVAVFRGLACGTKRAEALVLQIGSPYDFLARTGMSF